MSKKNTLLTFKGICMIFLLELFFFILSHLKVSKLPNKIVQIRMGHPVCYFDPTVPAVCNLNNVEFFIQGFVGLSPSQGGGKFHLNIKSGQKRCKLNYWQIQFLYYLVEIWLITVNFNQMTLMSKNKTKETLFQHFTFYFFPTF